MDRFIATLNIDHLRKQVLEEPDEPKRRILRDILAGEEARLAFIDIARRDVFKRA